MLPFLEQTRGVPAKTGSTFDMNNIRGRHLTCYKGEIQLPRSLGEQRHPVNGCVLDRRDLSPSSLQDVEISLALEWNPPFQTRN